MRACMESSRVWTLLPVRRKPDVIDIPIPRTFVGAALVAARPV